MKRIAIAFTLLTSVIIAAPDDDRVAARRTALDLAGAWSNDGFKLRDGHWSGTFKTGEAKLVQVNLYAGNQYWFTLGTTENAKKVAVSVFDENGKPVVFQLHQDGARAAAGFAPLISGSYIVKIEELEGQPSAFALIYSYK